jgi:hypothetical protein
MVVKVRDVHQNKCTHNTMATQLWHVTAQDREKVSEYNKETGSDQ